MELGSRLKKYRDALGLSQDDLALKIFVSRQTISNWETSKTYPDIKSLLLLSEVFSVSLDQLVKGDIEKMKKEIDAQDLIRFQKESTIFTCLFIVLLIIPIPLAEFMGWWGIIIYSMLFIVSMYYALRVEKYKKKFDIQTYKEIIAFSEGKSLDEIEKAKEVGKRPYQKFLLAIASALIVVMIAMIMGLILKS